LTTAADRRKTLEILDAAMAAGAGARVVADLLGVGLTALQRWRRKVEGDGEGLDRRKGSRRIVSHRLRDEEASQSWSLAANRNSRQCFRSRSCHNKRCAHPIRTWLIAVFVIPTDKPTATARNAAYAGCCMPTDKSTIDGRLIGGRDVIFAGSYRGRSQSRNYRPRRPQKQT